MSTIWQSLTTKYYSESYYRSSAHNNIWIWNLLVSQHGALKRSYIKWFLVLSWQQCWYPLNNETAAMFVSATNPQGIELCSYMQMLFCIGWKKFSLITRMKALYKRQCTTIIIIVIISIILLFECVSLSYLLYCKIQWS